jgi:4-amino-4-deoxy-L-arabinose transferase-like glycosyltransferase
MDAAQDGRPPLRPLLFLALLAFVIRAAMILLEPATRPVADERTWTNWALENLLTPKVAWNPLRTHMIFYPPGYPYFIAAAYAPFGTLEAVKWAQAVLGALLVPAVALSGWRAFDARTGLLAAGAVAVYPELVWFAAHFWSEVLFLTILWWSLERLLRADEPGPRRGAAVAAGLLWGLAILVRETSLYFTPLAAAWLLWPRPGDERRWRSEGLVFLLAAFLVVAPWTLRNWIVFEGAFVPVSTAGGQNLFQGNALIPRDETYVLVDAVPGRIAQYQYARRMGLQAIRDRQPTWAFEKLREQMPMFWEADSLVLIHLKRGAYGPYPRTVLVALAAVVLLPYLVLLPGFVAGLARSVAGGSRGALLLVAFLVYYNAIHVVTHGFARYRLPIMPVVMLLAAWAYVSRGRPAGPRLSPRAYRTLVAVLAVTMALVLAPSLSRLATEPALVGGETAQDEAK